MGRNVVFSGRMSGVSGMGNCESCKWAAIHKGPRTITKNGVTFTQYGDVIIDCEHDGDKSIDMSGDDIRCSGWEPRE